MNDIAACPAAITPAVDSVGRGTAGGDVRPSVGRRRPASVGPAGADRTALVASGNYWTPGPCSGRTVRLIGTHAVRGGARRDDPSGNMRRVGAG